jgi:hypothetical protein
MALNLFQPNTYESFMPDEAEDDELNMLEK